MGNYLIGFMPTMDKNFSDTFEILVKKQKNTNLTLGETYDWSIPQTSFIDLDGDQLTFTAYLMNNSIFTIKFTELAVF